MAAPVPNSSNPFQAPPDVDSGDWRSRYSAGDDEAEAIRMEHVNHEASIRSIGLLFYLGAGFIGLVGSAMFVGGLIVLTPGWVIASPFCLAMAVASGLLGHGLRKLSPRLRIAVGVLCVIVLLAVLRNAFVLYEALTLDGFQGHIRSSCVNLFAAIVHVYILVLLFCRKGSMVFSWEYQDVIARTPHIKGHTSLIVWIFVLILALQLALLIVGGIMAAVVR